MLSYADALRVVFRRADLERGDRPPYSERVWRLDRVRELLAALGNPQQRYRTARRSMPANLDPIALDGRRERCNCPAPRSCRKPYRKSGCDKKQNAMALHRFGSLGGV